VLPELPVEPDVPALPFWPEVPLLPVEPDVPEDPEDPAALFAVNMLPLESNPRTPTTVPVNTLVLL